MNISVGNLSWTLTEQDILFAPFGEVVSARIVVGNGGRSLGFGFVDMADDVEGQAAIQALNRVQIEQQAEQLANRNDLVQRTQTALKKVTAASGSAAAVTAVARPNVFVQFAGDLTRAQVDALREELEKAGFNAPEAERINRGQENEVRFLPIQPRKGSARSGSQRWHGYSSNSDGIR